MISFWKEVTPRYFQRFQSCQPQDTGATAAARSPACFAGNWTSEPGTSHTRPIIVYVKGFDTYFAGLGREILELDDQNPPSRSSLKC